MPSIVCVSFSDSICVSRSFLARISIVSSGSFLSIHTYGILLFLFMKPIDFSFTWDSHGCFTFFSFVKHAFCTVWELFIERQQVLQLDLKQKDKISNWNYFEQKPARKKKSRISISISRRLSEQKFQHNFITLAICIICTCDTKAVMWNTFEIFHLHLLNRAMRCLLLTAHVSRWNDWQSIHGAFFIWCIVWICQSRFHRFHWHSSQYDVLMRFLYLS